MINVLKLRRRIGILGMLLPLIVAVLSLAFGYGFPQSISATYYVPTCIAPFIIILGSASVLLLCYNGYDLQDRIVCAIAGLSGLGICLFPCDVGIRPVIKVGTFGLPCDISGIIHNSCAIVFFVLLAYNSVFLFTKTSGEMTTEKRRRNLIYRICGYGIAGSFALLIPFNLLQVAIGMWIVEAIGLVFFGISWLTKSQSIALLFKDKHNQITNN